MLEINPATAKYNIHITQPVEFSESKISKKDSIPSGSTKDLIKQVKQEKIRDVLLQPIS